MKKLETREKKEGGFDLKLFDKILQNWYNLSEEEIIDLIDKDPELAKLPAKTRIAILETIKKYQQKYDEEIKKYDEKIKKSSGETREKGLEGRKAGKLLEDVIRWLNWAEENGWSIKPHNERSWETNRLDESIIRIWATDTLLTAFEEQGFIDKIMEEIPFETETSFTGLDELFNMIKDKRVISMRIKGKSYWYLKIL